MTVSLKHKFQSAIADDPAAAAGGEVVPSNWNDEHNLTLATGKLLGRTTAGVGAVEEITPTTAFSYSADSLDLATTITAGGPVGSATVTPVITYDAKGRLTAVTSATVTPAASSVTGTGDLTKVDDTNVTLTLGGTPTGSLLKATSITVGWTGTLALSRLVRGTSGYALIGNGGSDTSYQGFLNAATGGVTRTWNDKASDYVSITDFGASTGASAATNLTALTNAVATGKPVFVPPGTFSCNPPTFGSVSMRLFGVMGQSILQLPASTNADFVTIGADSATGARTVIHDLTFDCNGANQTAGVGIKIKSNSGYTWLDRVRVLGAYQHGIHGISANYTFNGVQVRITNCQIQDYPFTTPHRTGDGIRLETAFQACAIIGCDISGGTTNSQTTAQIHLINGADCYVSGCNIWGETRKIWVDGAWPAYIVGNYIHADTETTACDGIVCSAGLGGVVSGNRLQSLTGVPIRLINGTNGWSVTGNSIKSDNVTLQPAHPITEEDTSDYNLICGNSSIGTFTSSAAIVIVGSHSIGDSNTAMTIANARLATMADSTIKGVAVGSGTSTPVDLTAAQAAAIIGSVGGAFKSKLISTTRDLTTATGTQAITGVGFTPTSVVAMAVVNTSGFGAYTSFGLADSAKAVMNVSQQGGGNTSQTTNLFLLGDSGGTNSQAVTISSYDADGLTLSWTKTGSPTGTAQIHLLCFR